MGVPSLDATLVWAPRERVRLRFALASDVQPSGLRNAFAHSTHAVLLAYEQRLRDDLRIALGVGAARVDYRILDREDLTLSGHAAVDYDLNRYAALVGRFDLERTGSSFPETGLEENRVTFLLRLRR